MEIEISLPIHVNGNWEQLSPLKCGDLPVLIRKENKLVDLGRRDFPSLLLCPIPNVVAMNARGEKKNPAAFCREIKTEQRFRLKL